MKLSRAEKMLQGKIKTMNREDYEKLVELEEVIEDIKRTKETIKRNEREIEILTLLQYLETKAKRLKRIKSYMVTKVAVIESLNYTLKNLEDKKIDYEYDLNKE